MHDGKGSMGEGMADMDTFDRWKEARTGMPIIDALMRELEVTGWMPNRGRRICASFLTMDANIDAKYGFYYFQEKLIDYDEALNFGGWNLTSGMGNSNKSFNAINQSSKVDFTGGYIQRWIPELAKIPAEHIHEPWYLTEAQQKEYDVIIQGEYASQGIYPEPVRIERYVGSDAEARHSKRKKRKGNTPEFKKKTGKMKHTKKARFNKNNARKIRRKESRE